MQSRRQKFRSWPLTWLLTALGATALLAGTPLASTRAAAANTAPPPSLYTALVPDSEPQRAAQLAMREVLVRLVGSRSAPDDPAFAGLIEDARRYVQIERGTTQGATQVIFDAAALRAALAAAGSSVRSRTGLCCGWSCPRCRTASRMICARSSTLRRSCAACRLPWSVRRTRARGRRRYSAMRAVPEPPRR